LAVRQTRPAEASHFLDWENIVDGVCFVDMAQHDDGRTLDFTVHRSSGSKNHFSFPVPALIYRSVFQEGQTYRRGDAVTYSGSLWHCDAETTTARPGTADWTLAVKRGSPGKDGKDGKP
jgi:hypothetical protein